MMRFIHNSCLLFLDNKALLRNVLEMGTHRTAVAGLGFGEKDSQGQGVSLFGVQRPSFAHW